MLSLQHLTGFVAVRVGLAGCSSLPTIVPDLDRRGGPAVLVDGPRGPLSAAQSRAVLVGLAADGPATRIFDRHLAREEALVGSPLTAGNEVTLLKDDPATYDAMLASIDAARDHINLETYILDDEVGARLARALIVKQAHGVR